MLPFLAGLLPAAGSLTAGGALKFAASQALPIIAWEGVSRLMHGSAEDQMREQMRIAEKLEAERGALLDSLLASAALAEEQATVHAAVRAGSGRVRPPGHAR